MSEGELGAQRNQPKKPQAVVAAWTQKEEIQETFLKNNKIWQHTRQRRGRGECGELPRSVAVRTWGVGGVSVRRGALERDQVKVGRAITSQVECESKETIIHPTKSRKMHIWMSFL